ncbi:MAG: GIY-YIG nuclease family protein [Planctomycetes bacterium]|nr:GIY-YIG nuclease family protein [Planctomycetota bacterium]
MDTACRKQQLDSELQGRKQVDLDQRAQDLGGRYLKETVKWIGSSLNQNNFAACKQRLLDAIERCRGIGHSVPSADEAGLIADLKLEYEEVVRSALAREEQARIKAQIREEQQREREKQKLERELEDARRAQDATARAVAAVEARRAAEIERVRAEMASLAAVDRERALADVEAKFAGESARLQAENAQLLQKVDELTPAVSMAQLTKSGHVYVISNIGSFGEGVFKVGMTRRLDPEDRIWELGDASVPFPFDVHMLISTKDAPTLENALHRALHQLRLNKVNLRKEFFRVDLQRIAQIVQEHHGEVKYVATPEALEYHQSITMTLEDQEFIEEAYEKADDDSTPAAGGE